MMWSYHIFTFVVLVYTKFLRDFGESSNASPSSPFFNCETIINYKMANTILLYNLLLFFIVVGKARCILKSVLLGQNYNVVVLYKSDCFLSLSFFLYYQIMYQFIREPAIFFHTKAHFSEPLNLHIPQ